MNQKKVAIIGCGAIGVTTALAIQRRIPDAEITIFAKEVTPNTTSDLAAGLWEPVYLKDTPNEKIQQWSMETYNRLLKWWREGHAKKYGICLQPMLFLTDEVDYEFPNWLESTVGHEALPPKVLAEMSRKCALQFTAGLYFVTFTWEGAIFLRTLQKEFKRNGGMIVKREIKDLNELADFDAIVNCAGLGARNLVGDINVEPIRGQVRKVVAPWLFNIITVDCSSKLAYIIPTTHQCTLGGTANYNNADTTVDDTDRKTIKRNCLELAPSLKSAKIVKDAVGLRPGRNKVRVEIEFIKYENRDLKIIHNYGHGGAGITLALGCAEEAANLLQLVVTKHKL